MRSLPVLAEVPAYEHHAGAAFKALPEVYQVELTNRCNLKCPMCLRTTDMVREDDVLDLRLLGLMHGRGDFAGTAYVELQMAGEPTLHPKLGDAVRYLRDEVGLLVGLSTHGLTMRKAGVVDALLDLDALTISVDSVDPEVYARMRVPAKLSMLETNLRQFFDAFASRRQLGRSVPFVELQLVVTSLEPTSGDVRAAASWMEREGYDRFATLRTTSDCFGEMQGRTSGNARNTTLCLNPFSSVSVTQSGDVVSCCFIFDPKPGSPNVYGNLYEQSLADIWASERVRAMQEEHRTGQLRGQCTACYLRSPTLIHQNIVSRLVRAQRADAKRRS